MIDFSGQLWLMRGRRIVNGSNRLKAFQVSIIVIRLLHQ